VDLLLPTASFGFIGSLIVAFIGSLIVAFIGACILIAILRAVTGNRTA